jgi:hypothetical protein
MVSGHETIHLVPTTCLRGAHKLFAFSVGADFLGPMLVQMHLRSAVIAIARPQYANLERAYLGRGPFSAYLAMVLGS